MSRGGGFAGGRGRFGGAGDGFRGRGGRGMGRDFRGEEIVSFSRHPVSFVKMCHSYHHPTLSWKHATRLQLGCLLVVPQCCTHLYRSSHSMQAATATSAHDKHSLIHRRE